ncbi:hypothetical protein ACJX0J_023168 [Zea mays]
MYVMKVAVDMYDLKNEAWKHQIMHQVLASLYHVAYDCMLYGDMQSGSVYPFPPFITQQKVSHCSILNNNHSYSFLFHHFYVDIFYSIGNRKIEACSLSLMAERSLSTEEYIWDIFLSMLLGTSYNYNLPKTTRDENKHIFTLVKYSLDSWIMVKGDTFFTQWGTCFPVVSARATLYCAKKKKKDKHIGSLVNAGVSALEGHNRRMRGSRPI